MSACLFCDAGIPTKRRIPIKIEVDGLEKILFVSDKDYDRIETLSKKKFSGNSRQRRKARRAASR